MIQTVKLAKLHLSALNVRTSSNLAIEPLAADILARGVLENLLATPVSKPRGHFAVFDGGRRLRALTLLVERGEIVADDYDVAIKVLKGDDATLTETSLAANFHQLQMTPAEECRAFQHFLGEDGDIDAVAKRFGVTRRFIEGRLRLANLAEPIFAALSAGEITLDIAKAYASTDNVEKQLLVFESYGSYGYVNADTIRRAIANETMKASDPVARLVGEDAYVAAGGGVERELFSDDGDRWVSPEIAQRLAAEIMEAEAARIGAETGLAWIRPIASRHVYGAASALHRVPLSPPPLTEEQEARLAVLDERMDVLSSQMEDEGLDEDAYDALAAEAETVEAERVAIHRRPRVLPDELRAEVGAFLTLSANGEMVLDPDYYSEAPIRRDNSGEPGGDDEDDGYDTGGRGVTVIQPRPEAVAPGGKPLSANLYNELAMQRRDVLAASLLAHPGLAIDYAIFVLADGGRHGARYGSTIAARRPQDPVGGDQPVTRARTYLAEAADGLPAGWTEPDSVVDRFEAFRALDDDSKAGWLALAVARSFEAKSDYSARQNALQNRLGTIMAVDVAGWWRPRGETYFDRVTKGSLLTLLEEIGGPALSGRYATLKKTEISSSCEKLFAGELIVEPEVKERALAWVPDAMRFLDQSDPATGEDDIFESDLEDVEVDAEEEAPSESGDATGEAPADDEEDVAAIA